MVLMYDNLLLHCFNNQLLQLCMACTVWSDLVIKPAFVCFGKCATQMVTNEKQRKTELTITRCFLKTNKSWIDFRPLTKIGVSANIDRPWNNS